MTYAPRSSVMIGPTRASSSWRSDTSCPAIPRPRLAGPEASAPDGCESLRCGLPAGASAPGAAHADHGKHHVVGLFLLLVRQHGVEILQAALELLDLIEADGHELLLRIDPLGQRLRPQLSAEHRFHALVVVLRSRADGFGHLVPGCSLRFGDLELGLQECETALDAVEHPVPAAPAAPHSHSPAVVAPHAPHVPTALGRGPRTALGHCHAAETGGDGCRSRETHQPLADHLQPPLQTEPGLPRALLSSRASLVHGRVNGTEQPTEGAGLDRDQTPNKR